jgi:hypothetical protein
MYKCGDCGALFEEPKTRVFKSDSYFYSSPDYVEDSTCPSCGVEDFEETVHCDYCGQHFLEDELCNGACPGCEEIAISNYTTDGGKRFLQWVGETPFDGEREFYSLTAGLEYCWNRKLIELLKAHTEVFEGFEESLKEYCLADISYWVDFYFWEKQQLEPVQKLVQTA